MESFPSSGFISAWHVFSAAGLKPEEAESLKKETDLALLAKEERSEIRIMTPSEDGILPLAEEFGSFIPGESTALLCGTFHMPEERTILLGMGADWWMEAYLDGEKILSTLKSGNGSSVSVFNNMRRIQIRGGRHFLSVFVRAGGGGWSFAAGIVTPNRETVKRIPYHLIYSRILPETPQINYGPWCSHPNPGEITVNFTTDGQIPSGIDYRKKGMELWHRVWDLLGGQVRTDRDHHHITLTGLEEDAVYEYRTVLLDPETLQEKRQEKIHSVRTFTKQPKEYRFFVAADTQFCIPERLAILNDYRDRCQAKTADFFVHLGDIGSGYDNFMHEVYDGFLSFLLGPDMVRIPFVPVRGNHEYRGAETNFYFRTFASPEGKSYSMFRHGEVCFLVLDTGEDKPRDPEHAPYTALTFDAVLMEEQKKWLTKALESEMFQSAKFRLVLAHSAPYTQGENYMTEAIRNLTDEFFAGKEPPYRIHAWLAGHIHQFLRSIPGTGMVAALQKPITAPSFGGERYGYPILSTAGPGSDRLQTSAFDVHVRNGELEIRSVLRSGEVFDTIRIAPDGTVTEKTTGVVQRFPAKG